MKYLLAGVLAFALSGVAMAEGSGKGGDEFRNTAARYAAQAQQARAKGQHEKARAYSRMAAIKRNAASLADKGRWSEIDWSEYHRLSAEVAGYKGKAHKGKGHNKGYK